MSGGRHTIIVGGGLMGVTTAWELVQRGERVTIVEAAEEVAAETSYANGGLLTASMSDPWNGPGVATQLLKSFFEPGAAVKLRLKAIPSLTAWGLQFLRNSSASRHKETTRWNYILSDYSVRETLRLSSSLGIEFDASELGTLKIFGSRQAADGPLLLSESYKEFGGEYELLDVEQVVTRDPELEHARDKIACGIYYKGDAAGDARTFTIALARHAKQAGVAVRTGCKVSAIKASKGRVDSVVIGAEEVAADRVILATGPWVSELARPLGVSVPVRPAKGYSVTVDMTNWSARPAMPVIDDAMHAGFIPLGDRVRLAGTAEFTGFDPRLSSERVQNLYDLFERIYPHLAAQIDTGTAEAWSAFRPMSATGRPIVGPAGPEGLWLNTGHGHLGWTMAVGSAKLLTAQILGDEPPVEPGAFSPVR